MPHDNAISGKHLDSRDSTRAEKPLKTGKLALAFKHQAHDFALHLIDSHRSRT